MRKSQEERGPALDQGERGRGTARQPPQSADRSRVHFEPTLWRGTTTWGLIGRDISVIRGARRGEQWRRRHFSRPESHRHRFDEPARPASRLLNSSHLHELVWLKSTSVFLGLHTGAGCELGEFMGRQAQCRYLKPRPGDNATTLPTYLCRGRDWANFVGSLDAE